MNFLKIYLDIYNFHAKISDMNENISENIKAYIKYLRSLGKSVHTTVNYEVDLRHFADYLEAQGIYDVSEIDARAIRIFLSSIIGVGEARTSASRRLSAVRGFTAWLCASGNLSGDPSLGIKGPKKPRAIARALSYDDTDRLLTDGPDKKSKTYERDRLVLELMYGAGLRVSELIGLSWNCVELDERMLTIMGKGDKERRVPIGEALQAMLKDWRSLHCTADDGPVFPSSKDGAGRLTVRTVDRIVTKAAMRVGLRGVTPHTLRHCCATHMLENGAPLRVVQEMLGHETIASTQRYLTITSEQIMKSYAAAHPMAADKFDVD